MAAKTKKLTKHQKELIKKFGDFRKRQAAQRARFAKVRAEIEAALLKFEDMSDELSPLKYKREKTRIHALVKKIV